MAPERETRQSKARFGQIKVPFVILFTKIEVPSAHLSSIREVCSLQPNQKIRSDFLYPRCDSENDLLVTDGDMTT